MSSEMEDGGGERCIHAFILYSVPSGTKALICIGLFWVTGLDLFGLHGLVLSFNLRTNSSSVLDHDQAYGTRVHASIGKKRIHSHDDTS
jgi:hypothetical protein